MYRLSKMSLDIQRNIGYKRHVRDYKRCLGNCCCNCSNSPDRRCHFHMLQNETPDIHSHAWKHLVIMHRKKVKAKSELCETFKNGWSSRFLSIHEMFRCSGFFHTYAVSTSVRGIPENIHQGSFHSGSYIHCYFYTPGNKHPRNFRHRTQQDKLHKI